MKPSPEIDRELRLIDIKLNPQRHQHAFPELQSCCFIDGAIDTELIDAHSHVLNRTNGGVRCDVARGPCACGAWH